MTNETTNLDEPEPPKPKATDSQTLLMHCPPTLGSEDLRAMVKGMTEAFTAYSFRGGLLSDGKLSLTVIRCDGKKLTKNSIFQVRRAWLMCVRGWRIRDNQGDQTLSF